MLYFMKTTFWFRFVFFVAIVPKSPQDIRVFAVCGVHQSARVWGAEGHEHIWDGGRSDQMPNSKFKGIVHPKMKITVWFTHPQAILGVYDFLLSDKYNQSYI